MPVTPSHPPTPVVVVQWPSRVPPFVTPWTAACQASLSLTISRSLPKFMSIASVMPSHSLTPSSPSALNLSQHQGLFQQVDCSHQMTKTLELQCFAPTPVVTTKNISWCYQMSPVESCFMCVKIFAFYNSVRQVMLLSVFYGWGNWGTEKLCNMSKFTGFVRGRVKTCSQDRFTWSPWLSSPMLHLTCCKIKLEKRKM